MMTDVPQTGEKADALKDEANDRAATAVEKSVPSEMSAEDFRRYGHELIDWISQYLSTLDQRPVLPPIKPGELKEQLPPTAPEEGEPMARIIADVDRLIAPNLTHWSHPAFFAYFAISTSAPGIFGELLSAAFNTNGMLWRTAPAAVELEEVVLSWLREMLGLPPHFEGIIYDTASVSTLHALAAARESLGLRVREDGLAGRPDLPPLCVYASEQAHSSVEKSVIALGLGQRAFRRIPTDERFRMKVGALERAIREDRNAGRLPCAVVATLGTTSTTSLDPVAEIAELCHANSIWLHVDAAYAGVAAMLPEKRDLFCGWEKADSITTNPHKWLATPLDLSAFYCRRMDLLRQAFSLIPDYLKTDEPVRNPMDYGIQLGRRFRALKLWMVMRYFGRRGLQAMIREHCHLAQTFADWIDDSPDWERAAPVPFSVVCFRARPPQLAALDAREIDELNALIADRVNATGRAFLSHTRLNGRLTLRLAIGNIRTTRTHLERTWELLQGALRATVAEMQVKRA
ncbi:pyridoxal-dependent decarboxylase [Pyrinomonas sp.]|uniref:pyridoxal phosphate-dependent decarboxylase family protein n=1 Tax=Pyrinomonas sp. TaxID=2080306 RepID=UPI00331D9828